MSRASNLLTKMQSWTETDWLLLRHHYPEDVARFAALLMDGPPRESERPEDPSPPSALPGDADLCKLTDGTWRLRLSDGTWAACDSPTGQKLETRVVEGPGLDRDSAPVLQLRRDVKWLRDRGVTGQVSMIPSTLAEMVGLDVSEYATLTLKTRQKFENRAYTALRTLNGGGR